MDIFAKNLRNWWQIPRKVEDRTRHRTVSFLELFYDLVYVVLIAELSHRLATHADWGGVLTYGFLFIIVWWAWYNGTSYHDLHGNNDIRTRVFTFVQMICVAGMAVFAHDAMGETSAQFAIAYGLFLLTLTILWWRVSVHDPIHGVLGRPYTAVFFFTTLLFWISAFVSAELRPYLWGVSVIIALLLPLYVINLGRQNPIAQQEINKVIIASPSLVERFGLFSIIVLGEIVVGVVAGLSEQHHLTLETLLTALLGMLIAIGLWWVYFDFVSHRIPYPNQFTIGGWFYTHLPLTAGIAAVGAAVLNIVEHAGEGMPANVRWLLVGSVALVLGCVAILINLVDSGSSTHEGIHLQGRNVMLVSALLILIIGFLPIPTLLTLFIIVLCLLAPIYFALRAWLQAYDEIQAEEQQTEAAH